ncbi:unnamed protein product [Pleuronectes platessa]|uniref:Uncharacterized protein n=1 Tax=Pleuronectes platessa TaxID=8262 RepID=A0A9N7TWN5_PLEPL|nr:unnamed protein product [Pleuronectes platessa]
MDGDVRERSSPAEARAQTGAQQGSSGPLYPHAGLCRVINPSQANWRRDAVEEIEMEVVVLPPWESIHLVAAEIRVWEKREEGRERERDVKRQRTREREGEKERQTAFRDLDGASGDSKALQLGSATSSRPENKYWFVSSGVAHRENGSELSSQNAPIRLRERRDRNGREEIRLKLHPWEKRE